ncbi:MAG: hypothetical protein ACRBBW_20885 [Cellvibrionaceae bacterium]
MQIRFLIVTITGLLMLVGCATTKMKTYVDPDYAGKQYSKILVNAPNANFEFKEILLDSFCKGLKDRGVECVVQDDLFPPTRTYSNQAAKDRIAELGIDGWLTVNLGAGGSSSRYMGSHVFGSATTTGNTISGSSNSIAMHSFSRQQGYSIEMYDTKSERKAFVMSASTSASGLANITNSVFAKSLAKKIIDEMSASKLIDN